ncbi:alpha/beta fold hydrolase [Shouchella shacheensis]|uniref:alpha/beta fold hydrolase n=1 Tax=Shouchella shacheensis TaxID=1649580 RepID=UPI0007404452|nr:alpha/beta hydrolase [Shouchella shacheensis]
MRGVGSASFFYIHNASVYVEQHACKRGKAAGVVVLIHGFIASSHSYHRLIPYLTKTHQVVVFDLPGFGRSSKHRGAAYSFSDYATLTEELLERLGASRVILVGHSMGGQVALCVAKRNKALVRSLILLASSGYLRRVKPGYILATFAPYSAHLLQKWTKQQSVREMLEQVVYSKRCITKEMIDCYRRPLEDPSFYEALLYLARQREGDLSQEDLQTIETPTLVIGAKQDRLIPVETSARLATDLPNATHTVFERCGHLIAEEYPKKTAKRILSFAAKNV